MYSLSRIAACALLFSGCANTDEIDLEAVEPSEEEAPVSADAVPYAADVQWVSRSPMTAASYLSEKATWEAAGFLLMDISAYPINGAVRYAAIWEKNGGPLRKSEHLQTSAQLVANDITYSQQGYRLEVLEPYESAGQTRFAAIWEQVTGSVDRRFSYQLSAAQYNAEYTTRTQQGYRLLMVDGYTIGGVEYFATLWDKAVGAELQPRIQMTSATYQSNFTTFANLGYRLKHVSAYKVGSADRFAAIWEKAAGVGYLSHHAMPATDYQHKTIDYYLQGYHPTQLDGYWSAANQDRYAAVFEVQPNALTGNYCKNGYCFNLDTLANKLVSTFDPPTEKWGFEVRRGTRVIQRSGGVDRSSVDSPTGDNAFTVHDRFDPASVGKTVAAVALLQLLSAKGISVDAQIGPYLPPSWNVPAINKQITFAEVLGHKAGLFTADGGNGHLYANVKQLMEHAITLPKVTDYENINYDLVRVLVASLDGYVDWANGDGSATRFTTYMNNKIFAPLGIYNVINKALPGDTLFYPNPNPAPGPNGTSYGDKTLSPGYRGIHLSLHELTVFHQAMSAGYILPSASVSQIKTRSAVELGIGWWDMITFADGTKCWGKDGENPAPNQLRTWIVSCDNGVTSTLMVNGATNPETTGFQEAMKAAFTPQ